MFLNPSRNTVYQLLCSHTFNSLSHFVCQCRRRYLYRRFVCWEILSRHGICLRCTVSFRASQISYIFFFFTSWVFHQFFRSSLVSHFWAVLIFVHFQKLSVLHKCWAADLSLMIYTQLVLMLYATVIISYVEVQKMFEFVRSPENVLSSWRLQKLSKSLCENIVKNVWIYEKLSKCLSSPKYFLFKFWIRENRRKYLNSQKAEKFFFFFLANFSKYHEFFISFSSEFCSSTNLLHLAFVLVSLVSFNWNLLLHLIFCYMSFCVCVRARACAQYHWGNVRVW